MELIIKYLVAQPPVHFLHLSVLFKDRIEKCVVLCCMDNGHPSLFSLNAELSYYILMGKPSGSSEESWENTKLLCLFPIWGKNLSVFRTLGCLSLSRPKSRYRFFVRHFFLSYEGYSVSRSYAAVLWLAVSGSVSIWDCLSGAPSSKGKTLPKSLLNPVPSAIETKDVWFSHLHHYSWVNKLLYDSLVPLTHHAWFY